MVEPVNGRVLDWKPQFDTRSLAFTITDNFSTRYPPRKHLWHRGAWLNQGTEGACTGFGLAHVLTCRPRAHPNVDETQARGFYYGAQLEDQWEGNSYEGSSVLGAMRHAHKQGLVSVYYWARTVEEIITGVGYRGPMEIGVNWYDGMFDTDENGYLHVTGRVQGGHALCVGGVDPKRERFRLDNSWGREFGWDGSAWISFTDMDRLLHEDGEAALPKKVKP